MSTTQRTVQRTVAMHCEYVDVFGAGFNRAVYELALGRRSVFTRSKTSPSRHFPDWRRSTVVYHDHLAPIRAAFEAAVVSRLPEVLARLRLPQFTIDALELQLTSHNDGEYYHWHTDNGTPATASRVVTFVYYFHGMPRRFSGGELVLFPPNGEPTVVEPRNDSMVLFCSHMRHEVRPVACPSRRFEDGRFTLNGWVRRRARMRDDATFGYSMFVSPHRRTTHPPPAPMPAAHVAPPSTDPARGDSAHQKSRPVGAVPPPGRSALPRPTAGATARSNTDARALAARVAKLESLLDLYGDLHRLSGAGGSIDVVRQLTGREFYERYYYRNRPVLLQGLIAESEAVRRWSPAFFASRFADVPVEITAGRAGDPLYERHFRRSVTTLPMVEFVARLTQDDASNDCYLVARNLFFANPAFSPLRADLAPPPDIVDTSCRDSGSVKLWFGPKGTVTPLHHDEHSILFTQVHGRKHFKLIPSFDLPKLYLEDNFYSAVDPEHVDDERHPAYGNASVIDLLMHPGDALFIPVGWWHWVKSLDVSISATFSSFHVPGRNTSWSPRLDASGH